MGRGITPKDTKTVNFEYLYEFAYKNKLNITEMSINIGKGKSFIGDCKKTGKMPDVYIRLLCALYNLDYDTLTTVETKGNNVPDDTTKFLLEMVQNLSERVAILEKSHSQKDINLSDQEQIILLLQQMTKFGQCEESAFKTKAKSYGFSKEMVDFAIENQKLKRDVSGGKVWLVKK